MSRYRCCLRDHPLGLTAQVVNGRDVELSWQPGPGPVPVGYHLNRNGTRITVSPVAQPVFTDPNLFDGAYTYRVIAVGPHGRESDPSDPVTVAVDLTPPTVALTSPADGRRVGSEVSIYGTAFAADDFAFWEIAARPVGAPGWIVLDTETAPVIGGFMTSWITQLAPWSDGPHELRLAAEDVVGNRAERVISVIIDNTAPDPGPVNLQATLVALDPDGLVNDIQLSWSLAPTPPDLAGFYLYRNGFLANAGGPVIGDPSPFLLPGTTYDDEDVADGTYTYGVVAADTAGNVSSLSNPAGPITIDVRRPHAVITSPSHLTQFEGAIEIIVECEDDDVVSLDLEYRLASEPDWVAVAPSFPGPPYVAIFSPPENGNYQIRALAADAFGPDPAPHIIQLNAVDLPPAAPLQVTAGVAGSDVTLTWIAPPDPGDDLAGYDIERDGQPINADLIPPDTLAYIDAGLADRIYSYRVVAVDQAAQRGRSDPVSVAVLTPFWEWRGGVTHGETADLGGGGCHPLGSVEIQRSDEGGSPQTVAVVEADGNGVFELEDTPLNPGANSFTAVSRDDHGNTSLSSLPLLVVSRPYPNPDRPENFDAAVAGSDVTLTWTAPPEPESAGFEVSRSGSVINETVSAWPYDASGDTLNASGGDPATWPLVVDEDPSTGWTSSTSPSMGRPAWWSWIWPDPVELDEIIVGWSPTDPPQIFDVDVLTSGGWLWLMSTNWNGQPTTIIPSGITAIGVRVRVPMTGSCGSSACPPVLTEVALSRAERTMGNGLVDSGLADGPYTYEVRQRNVWGQWSSAAATSVAVGPDQPLPPSDLSITPVDCGGLALQWQPAATQPGALAGFRLYRSEAQGGPFQLRYNLNASQTSVTDGTTPVGIEHHYVVTSLVNLAGIIVESDPSPSASGTAACVNPPAPVITQPTTAGHPIQITPSQVPIVVRGNAVPGSTITLLHDGVPVETKGSSSVFWFADVDVHPGTNTYVVRQELLSNITDSAPITVELDPSLLPDLEAVSLTVSPAAAAPDDLVMIEGIVDLPSTAGDAAAFDVVFELEEPAGGASEIYRTSLYLQPGERATVRALWNADGPAGLVDWRFVVDPDNDVMETDEDNNLATATGRVLAGEGLELSVGVDRSLYLVGQQLTGRVIFRQRRSARGLPARNPSRRRSGPARRSPRRAHPDELRWELDRSRHRPPLDRALSRAVSSACRGPDRRRDRGRESGAVPARSTHLRRGRSLDGSLIVSGGNPGCGRRTDPQPRTDLRRRPRRHFERDRRDDRRRRCPPGGAGNRHRGRRHRGNQLELVLGRRDAGSVPRGAGRPRRRGNDAGDRRPLRLHHHPRRPPPGCADRALGIAGRAGDRSDGFGDHREHRAHRSGAFGDRDQAHRSRRAADRRGAQPHDLPGGRGEFCDRATPRHLRP